MGSVYLVNERNTSLDLSGVQDVSGVPFSLQPKGRLGSSRECPDTVLQHPVVKRLLDSGWLSKSSSKPKEAKELLPRVIEAPKVIPAVAPGTTVVPIAGQLTSRAVSDSILPYTDNAPPYVAPATVTDEQVEMAQNMKPDDTKETDKERIPGYSEEPLRGTPPPPPPPPGTPGAPPPTVTGTPAPTAAPHDQDGQRDAQQQKEDEDKPDESKSTKTSRRK